MESILTKIFTFIANVFGVVIDGVDGAILNILGLKGTETLDFFFAIFSASLDFMGLFRVFGVGLIFLIYVYQLFKTFFGPISTGTEHPVYLTIRALFYTMFVLSADMFTAMFVEIATVPYQALMSIDTSAQNLDSFKYGAKLMESETGIVQHLISTGIQVTGMVVFGGALVVLFASLMMGVVAYSYVKFALEIFERYVILAVLILFAPLCIATGVSQNTNRIMSGWFKMFISQLVLMSMSVFFLRMFENGLVQIFANMGVTSFKHFASKNRLLTELLRGIPGIFTGMLMLFAWLRTAQRIDSHMASMGMTAAQSGGGLGADLFGGIRATGGFALGATNKFAGTNYQNLTQAIAGEVGGVANKMSQGASAVGDIMKGKKPQVGQDSISNYLKKDGQKSRSMSPLEKAAVKSSLKKGQGLNKDAIKDQLKSGGKLGAHAAVGAGIQDLMGGAIPEGFEATEGAVDGQKGVMSATFTNADGESFDVAFSENPLGEGSIAVQDEDGNTWYATAQGDGAAEFYSGNSNSVDEAEGADAVEYAGGQTEMDQQGEAGGLEGQAMEPDQAGEYVELEDGTLEQIDGDTGFSAVDVNGEAHDVSDMVDEDGNFVGGEDAVMGTLDEDGNFVESEDGEGTHMQDADGNVFEMAEGENGEVGFAEGGQTIEGEGSNASFMAKDVNGTMHDMSGKVDANGNYVGEGKIGSLDENGNFVESENGVGTHMQDADGNVFEMNNGGESFADGGMYKTSTTGETGTFAKDIAGNTHEMSDHLDENGVVQGQRFSMDENGELVADDNGNIVQTSDGAMFEVDADGKAQTYQGGGVAHFSKVADTPEGLAGAKFSKNENGEMVADSNGNYVQTSSGGFAQLSDNGTVNTFSASGTGSGEYVGFKNENGGTSYARASFNSDGSIQTNADGSINLENGVSVPAGAYAESAAKAGNSPGMVDVGGENFSLGTGSFDSNGNVETYSPVMKDGEIAYDSQGNMQFEKSTGGSFVKDSQGNFREVGAASLDAPGVGAGSTMRNASGEQFTLGSNSVDSSGNVQTYSPIKDADGNVQMKNGEPQYQASSNGSYVMDSNGNMQELAPQGSSGAFNLKANAGVGDYAKVSGEGTYQASDGTNYAELAPTTNMQTYEKTDQGFRPSPNGDYVQKVDSSGDATFAKVAESGQASNGAALRYSQNENGDFVRDNNGSYVQTVDSKGNTDYSRVSDSSIRGSTDVQRFSYDKSSNSYVPDAKGDSVQTYDSDGNVTYSKLDRSSISNKGVATFNKSIKNGAHSIPIKPAVGKTITPTYNSAGANSGNYFKSGGKMYSLTEPGSLKSDGSVQRYSMNSNGQPVKDDNGDYVKGRAEGATTPTFRRVGGGELERFNKGYTVGTARVNEHGAINIGPKDKMVNNKDGTIDLKFADGRTARLSNANMYKNTGSVHDPAYAGTIRFGGSDYHYQDTTPAYKSFGANVNPGDSLQGKAFGNVKKSLEGDDDFIRKSTFGSGRYLSMKDYNFKASDIQSGRIATYVEGKNGQMRPATETEVKDSKVEKFVQPRRNGGFVRGRGFSKNGTLREAYHTKSKVSRAEIGKDGHLYIYNQPNKDGTQDVFCAVSTKTGKVPKGNYETKVINNEQYYVVKRQINPSKGSKSVNVETRNENKTQSSFSLKKGVSLEKRAPVKYNAKVDKIIDR